MAAATTKEFLSAIWGDQEGICSVAMGRPNPENPEKTKGFWEKPFAYPAELDRLLSEIPGANGKLNVYFGVCLKKWRWPRVNSQGEEEKRATKENTLSSTAIWADIDFKTTPLEKAIANLKAFPLKCSIGVLSGGGIQAFWLLKEPVTGAEDLARVEKANQALSKIIGGDHTQDTARVLRMPGTMNVKYVPSREATLAPGTWRPDLRYTLDDIEQFLPEDVPVEASFRLLPPAGSSPSAPSMSAEVESLPVSLIAKKIIQEGVVAYREFRKSTDTPAKYSEREAAGKLSRSESDCYVVTTLLQHQVPAATIQEIFRNPANQVGEKYREKGSGGDRYLDRTIRTCQKTLDSNPKWPPAGEVIGSQRGPRAVPSIVLEEERISKIASLFSEIWIEDDRHAMATRVAGMLASYGVSLQSALVVIAAASSAVSLNAEKCLKDVKDAYSNFLAGAEVDGGAAIEKMIDSAFPSVAKDRAKKVLNAIRKSIPKPPKPPSSDVGAGEFEIVRLVKFDSRPAQWKVTLRLRDGRELDTKVETNNLIAFKIFRGSFYEDTHVMLSSMKEERWKRMLGDIEPEVKEAPKEATPEGAIESAFEEFLSDAKERPDAAMLKAYAGYDEGSSYFMFGAFKLFIRERGLRQEDRNLFYHIKHLGYKTDVKRISHKPQRVWIKALDGSYTPGNGDTGIGGPSNADGNGHRPPNPSNSAQIQQKSDDLFQQTENHGDQETQ